jgi:hypothetical protein
MDFSKKAIGQQGTAHRGIGEDRTENYFLSRDYSVGRKATAQQILAQDEE